MRLTLDGAGGIEDVVGAEPRNACRLGATAYTRDELVDMDFVGSVGVVNTNPTYR